MRKYLSALCCLAVALTADSTHADIFNSFSTTAYASNDPDWFNNTADDIDGNGLGTDGFFFFGNFDDDANNQPFTRNTQSLPGFVISVAAGADFLSVADNDGTTPIYDPVLDDGTLSPGGTAVFRNGTGLPAGDFVDNALQFTLSGVTDTVRVGVLVANEGTDDGRWDPTSVTITDGGIGPASTVTVGDATTNQLPIIDGADAGWLFFDIDADGTYTLGGTKRLAGNQGISFGGLTFDTASAIPEPSSIAILGLGVMGLVTRRRR